METNCILKGLAAIQSDASRHRIVKVENHDEAYYIWREAGEQQRILVHLDAHDDIWWVPDQTFPTIANFICPALKEGLVREVYWVVPDETWANSSTLKPLLRWVKKIVQSYPGEPPAIKFEPQGIATYALGKPFKICPLNRLPRFSEEVLLDIDLDYLVIPRACHSGLEPPTMPWCWPEDLLAKIDHCGLRSGLVTIAFSVEGGYTPLKWKYLGEELALRLRRSQPEAAKLRGMDLMRTAALAASQGDFAAAAAKYLEAAELIPDSPAPHYHLAYLYLDQGKSGPASERYRRALSLDPSYRTAYSNAGLWYYSNRQFSAAAREFRRTMALDPEDPYAYLGLGRIAVKQKRWTEAEAWLRQALILKGDFLDAHRSLGKVLAKQGRRPEAIAAYERSLTLALKGVLPLTPAIVTRTEDSRMVDPHHFLIHGRLARLYDLQGDVLRAINGYRMCIAKGGDGVIPRAHLARLYLRQRQFVNLARESWQMLRLIPSDLKKTGLRFLRRLRRRARRGYRAILGT